MKRQDIWYHGFMISSVIATVFSINAAVSSRYDQGAYYLIWAAILKLYADDFDV